MYPYHLRKVVIVSEDFLVRNEGEVSTSGIRGPLGNSSVSKCITV